MFEFLELTDGTVGNACELTDGISYALVSFAPVIPPLRDDLLGARSPWAETQAVITFHSMGETAAVAYAAARALNSLLDNARRWADGLSVTPIRLRAKAQGSTLPVLEAPVFGRARGGPPNMALPAIYSTTYQKYVIENITITMTLGTPFLSKLSESASGSAVANPGVMTVTMPSAPATPGPCVVTLAGFALSASAVLDIPDGYLLLATDPFALGGGIALFQGESPFTQTLAAGAAFTATADATARASNGNVGRLNHAAAAAGAESRLFYALLNWGASRRMAVFCTVRNNSASVWSIRAENVRVDLALATPGTRTTVIAAGPSNPQVLFLGELDYMDGSEGLNIYAAATTISGTCTLDIDTIAIVDMTDGRAIILQVSGRRVTMLNLLPSSAVDLRVETRPLLDPNPRARHTQGGASLPTSYSGSPSVWLGGSVIKLLWYATHLFGGTTPYWTTQNAAGSAAVSLTPTITRQTTYLVCE